MLRGRSPRVKMQLCAAGVNQVPAATLRLMLAWDGVRPLAPDADALTVHTCAPGVAFIRTGCRGFHVSADIANQEQTGI